MEAIKVEGKEGKRQNAKERGKRGGKKKLFFRVKMCLTY